MHCFVKLSYLRGGGYHGAFPFVGMKPSDGDVFCNFGRSLLHENNLLSFIDGLFPFDMKRQNPF